MADTSVKSAWGGEENSFDYQDDGPGGQNMRAARLAHMREMEVQKRKQRSSQAGMVFRSESENRGRKGRRSGAKRQSSTASTAGLLRESTNDSYTSESSYSSRRRESEQYGYTPTMRDIDTESLEDLRLSDEDEVKNKSRVTDTERDLLARGIVTVYDPTKEEKSEKSKKRAAEKEKAAEEEKVSEVATSSTKVSKKEKNKQPTNITAELDFTDLKSFVSEPPPEGIKILCRIIRRKSGMEKSMYPTYCLYLEKANNQKQFLLAGRKRKKSRNSNYLISMDREDLARNSSNFVGKARSNFVGTSFTIYDNGENPEKARSGKEARRELAGIQYDPNLMGWKGPRKMNIVLPSVEDGIISEVRPRRENDGLLEMAKRGSKDVMKLKNKKPTWNEDTQSYVLNFHGRVTMASVKNFQIVGDDEDKVLLQFGRVGEDAFTMDYQYPMTALQAFGIVLTSFDGKLACE